MRSRYLFFFLLLTWSCNNIDDAKPNNLSSFIKIYEGTEDFEGVDVASDNDGYVILGRINLTADQKDILVIKTNNSGQEQWRMTIPDADPKSIQVTDDGYLIAADGIQLNPEASDLNELKNTTARLIKMDAAGNITNEFVQTENLGTEEDPQTVDFHGDAVTLKDDGTMVFLGSFKTPSLASREKSFVVALDQNFQPVWEQTYDLQDRDYQNCSSVFISNDNLLWASTSTKEAQNIASDYVSILYTAQNSTFENNDLFGENDTRNHLATEMKKSGLNFGVVGTYKGSTGENANVYFLRVNQYGNIIPNSARYFDGQEETLEDRNTSFTQDEGNAIAGLSDGGYAIAGATLSTPEFGNGADDILLIRLDAFGNPQWRKLIGGSGDEVVHAITEAADGGLVLVGTNTVSGLQTIFMIKTNKNGELK